MNRIFPAAILVLTLLSACTNTPRESKSYFDSLVTSNIQHLTRQRAKLFKQASIHQQPDTATVRPDSAKWSSELDAFRQLNAFQKPAYRDAYVVTDGLKDPQSNLTIREIKAQQPVPITWVRYYYYRELKNLKKIEAEHRETNTLYTTTRYLTMEFDEKNGKAYLTKYTINGQQQMVLSDSIDYLITSIIKY